MSAEPRRASQAGAMRSARTIHMRDFIRHMDPEHADDGSINPRVHFCSDARCII